MIQTATTAQLDNAQRVAITMARYTADHNAPCINLIEHMTLSKGEKSITVPKVGQVTWEDLEDGVDMVESADIGMTTKSLNTSEAGVKMILTDKLVTQENEDVFKMVGRQIGDGYARKRDRDVLNLFSALNGGTSLGATTKTLKLINLTACIAFAKANKFPTPVSIVHHPNAVFHTTFYNTATPGATYPIPRGFSEDLLRDFYKFVINGVAIFEDGNIDQDANGDGVGAIFSKESMVYVESKGFSTARQRDESLRATEVIAVADYGCFELDDGYGAPMTYVITNVATNG
jgi:hypothetical protein